MAEPTEFQTRLMATLQKCRNEHASISELAERMKSNRVAVNSAVRSLERNGLAVTWRSDSSQWAVLMVAPTEAWRTRGVATGAVPLTDERIAELWYGGREPGHDVAPGYAVTFARAIERDERGAADGVTTCAGSCCDCGKGCTTAGVSELDGQVKRPADADGG